MWFELYEKIEKVLVGPVALVSVFFLLSAINVAATNSWGWTGTETFIAYVVSVGSIIRVTVLLTQEISERSNRRTDDTD